MNTISEVTKDPKDREADADRIARESEARHAEVAEGQEAETDDQNAVDAVNAKGTDEPTPAA